MPETFVFYLFAGLAIVASALVIGQRNPMYSVLMLIVSFAALAGLLAQSALWANRAIDVWLRRRLHGTTDGDAVTALTLIGFAGRVLVWLVTALLVLDHLGVEQVVFREPVHGSCEVGQLLARLGPRAPQRVDEVQRVLEFGGVVVVRPGRVSPRRLPVCHDVTIIPPLTGYMQAATIRPVT